MPPNNTIYFNRLNNDILASLRNFEPSYGIRHLAAESSRAVEFAFLLWNLTFFIKTIFFQKNYLNVAPLQRRQRNLQFDFILTSCNKQ